MSSTNTHYQLIQKNINQSWLVVTGFIAFITISSYIMSVGFGTGLDLVGLALIIGGIGSLISYWFSDKIILLTSGARPATRQEFFDFYTVTENLVLGQRMPMPKLYVIDDSAMNAFATGRDPHHAVVCATTGLLTRLNRSEIEAVVAHELSHVQNYDIRLMSIVSILVGMISLLADILLRSVAHGSDGDDDSGSNKFRFILFIAGVVLAMFSPFIAQMIQLAISRKREFLADASAIGMTKNPAGLINALKKLASDTEPLEAANKATAHLYISDPLKNVHSGVGWFASWFQTHPPVEERIKMLESL